MTQDQVQEIMNAVAQMKSEVNSNSGLAVLLETNPYQALVQSGAPVSSWPADVISNFNASLVSNTTASTLGQKRSGPDSWACFFCKYGVVAVMVAAVAAAGIAIASGFGFALGIIVAAGALAVGLTVATVTALAAAVGTVSITTGISKLADLICNAIPNTCQQTPVISGPWSANRELGWTTAYEPALVSFQGQPFALHRGNSIDGQLYYAAFNPTTGDWPNDTLLHNTSLNSGPTACVNSGVLCVSYLIQNPENALRFRSTSDANTWSAEMPLQGTVAAAAAPGMAEWNNNIICVYPSAADGTLQSVIVSTSGSMIGSPSVISGTSASAPPSLEWFNGALYCAYADKTTNKLMLMYFTEAANQWSSPVAVVGASVTLTDGPALSAVGVSTLYCLYTGSDSNLYYMSAQQPASGNGLSWTTPLQLQYQNSARGPALVSQGSDGLMALHRGTGGDQSMWWTTATPKST
jgi:hypothetical protein